MKAIFSTKWGRDIVFKGGTSLSKSWRLIERFSEDIDLALDRKVLGFEQTMLAKNQVDKLRKAASQFISTEFKEGLISALDNLGVGSNLYNISVVETNGTDVDPRILELHYTSVLEPDDYMRGRVLIEIGARSLREPCSEKIITSIIEETFPGRPFSGSPFGVQTVEPRRTFLEKIFLLHEEFSKPENKMRHERLSRHLYDIERLMDTINGKAALQDIQLYHTIIEHRKRITPIRGIDYANHAPNKINFIPPVIVIDRWKKDYADMHTMIYGETLPFESLIDRMHELLNRLRALGKE